MNSIEFDKLLALVIADEASGDEVKQLIDAMNNDRSLLLEARYHFQLHGQLGVALESEFSREKALSMIKSEIEIGDAEEFTQRVSRKIHRQLWIKRAMMAAAVMLIGISSVLFVSQFSANDDAPENLSAVASVTAISGVQWLDDEYKEGDSIISGQKVRFGSGLLELDLGGRGSLVIEGPAHLDFTSAMESVLHRGSLVMRATEQGHGYTVKTSQGSVVDLGTEFAVSVNADNSVETHVIEGSVEAIAYDGTSVTLKANDARRFNETSGQAIPADIGKFYTSMPPTQQKYKYAHWSFDENEGDLAQASGELGESESVNKDLVLYAIDEGVKPRWTKGMKNSGIYFDGKGGFAQSEYQGIQGGKARTVCCWVKVPEDFLAAQGYGIISWGKPTKLGETWQISVNPDSQDGKVGTLRLGLLGGHIIGSTDLRDGDWHHIAVVLYGGSSPNVGTHALLYVDGKQEAVSRASLQEVKTNSSNGDYGVWLGRNVTYRKNARNKSRNPKRFFRGGVDELYIFDSAISETQIQELMKR